MGYYGWITWDFDEERDLKNYKAWVCDAKDSYPINRPFDLWRGITVAEHPTLQYGAGIYSLPGNKGWEWRLKGAVEYIALIETTEEERTQREPVFRERLAPWIEDFEEQWRGKMVPELVEYAERLKKVDVERISDFELKEHFEDWLRISEIVWLRHFEAFYPVLTVYILFDDLCRELLGVDEHHPQFKALMSGFENRTFQTDKGLWRLAERANELGLEPTFQDIKDDEELLTKLGESEPGRKWLEEVQGVLETDGWRCPGHVFQVSNPSWIEKPSLALPYIRRAMARGGVFVLEQEQERLAKEREEAERDILSRVPEDKRGWFGKLMRTAQWSGRWCEEHVFYCEHYFNALGRRIMREMGNRLAQEGAIEDPEDIYFLLPDEIRIRIVPKGRFNALELVQIRKREYEDYVRAEPMPPLLGDLDTVIRWTALDCVARVVATAPIVKPELKADLYGSASAPGVADGTARLIMGEEELHLVQPGDILVTITTSPAWTPLFGIVKGVVTDTGSGLSHAVIVGREYGIPVVAGTIEGTRKIKTGQRIRVDGDMGAVYILG